jgi:hypothetical protein
MILAQMQETEEGPVMVPVTRELGVRIGEQILTYEELLAMDPAEREAGGVHEVQPPAPDPLGRRPVSFQILQEEGAWAWVNTYPDVTLEEARTLALAQLALRRKVAVRSFSFGGLTLDLDKDTEDAIAKCKQGLEALEAHDVEDPFIDFEVSRGVFAVMDLPTVTALSLAAFAHVQECFSNVKTLTLAIQSAETVEDLLVLDLGIGWP